MKKSVSLIFLLVLVAAQFLSPKPARAAGNAYYVSKSGNDSNPGTLASPWRSIQKAANIAVAGDTVYVRGGTYYEKVIVKNSGAAGAYITFSAYPGEVPIIDANGINMVEYFEGGFTISAKNYIRVNGLRVINVTDGFGIVCYRSDHCAIENNSTYNTYMSGIAVRTSTNVIVEANDVELANNNGEQEMITISGSSFVNVLHNRVHDGGPGTNGGEGIDVKDGSHDVLVHGNEVFNVPRLGIYVDAWTSHTYNITIDGNIVHHSARTGMAVASERGGELNNVTITNNLVYQNGRAGLAVGAWDEGYAHPIHHIYIVNNTFYQNGISSTLWGGGISVENGDFSNLYIANNILSDNVRYTIELLESSANVTITHNLIDGYRGDDNETRGSNYIEADPLFANASSLDFGLLADSPAINAGTEQYAPLEDISGNPRAAVDIGAYEFADDGGTPGEPVALLSENFDRRLSGWVKSGRVVSYSGSPHNGARSAMFKGNASLTRLVSTQGYTTIQLTICIGAKSYEDQERLSLAWWDGSAWQTLAAITDGAAGENGLLNRVTFSLPASAADRADFKIRIMQASADSGDYTFIDDLEISGVPK